MNETIRIAIADRLKNTTLGFLRIKRNLAIGDFSDREVENLLRKIILATPMEHIQTKGKNYYFTCPEFNAILTVNSNSDTIITARKITKSEAVVQDASF